MQVLSQGPSSLENQFLLLNLLSRSSHAVFPSGGFFSSEGLGNFGELITVEDFLRPGKIFPDRESLRTKKEIST